MKKEKQTMRSGKQRYVYTVFILVAVMCGVIWMITNVGYDCEYNISMSYRFLKGDKMFLEMWEPHQTSVYLPAFLMWIYMKVMGTTTGIVIYLQICGILIRGALSVLLYHVLKEDVDAHVIYAMALLYFMVSPKDYAMPEFGNLQLWFSTLLFCSVWTYFKTNKTGYLIAGAISLCLEVLAYPSCAIVLIGMIGIFKGYSAYKKRDILLFTGICIGVGILWAGYFVVTIGPGTLKECLSGMLLLEPTHTENPITKWTNYSKNILVQILILLAVGFLAALICGLAYLLTGRKWERQQKAWYWILCCCFVFLAGFGANILSLENRCAYSTIFLFLVGLGLFHGRGLQGREKQIYVCGSVIGSLGFLATLTLSNLPFSVSVAYGLLAIAVSFIPIEKKVQKLSDKKIRRGLHGCFFCLVILLAFRCVYTRIPLSGKGQICSSFSGMSIVRDGPALGIISNEEGVCIQRDSYPEWKELIRQGEKVWIVGGVVDTLGYLYQDVEVAGPSTMSTPSYGEEILEYWRINPDKYPDVIVAESYMGQLSYDLLAHPWLLEWIEKEYQPEQIVDGIYWKYYFRKARQTWE